MNFDTDIMGIIVKAVISIVIIFVGRYLIPWAKQTFVKGWVAEAVKAAEQVYGSGQGKVKKEDVLAFMSDVLNKYKIKITAKELDVLIESSVKKLHLEEVQVSSGN